MVIDGAVAPLVAAPPFSACPPIGAELLAPLRTTAIILVAFVQVPDVWLDAVATKYAVRDELVLAPVLASISIHPGTVPEATGTVGGVVDVSLYAKMTMISPIWWAGIVTEDDATAFEPAIVIAMTMSPC
jgi:hypothetical protein